jgi:D-sedoheptulose 7-phosphate isomerase
VTAQRTGNLEQRNQGEDLATADVRAHFNAGLLELARLATTVSESLGPDLERALSMVRETVAARRTLFFCGNGGSAADAQHMATEYVVRYARNRRAYPAIALTTDTSLLTAAGNDFGFDKIFSRQVEALGKQGDLLIIHSTSGNSPNVLVAAESARELGVQVLAFIARDGGKLLPLADHSVVIPTDRTDLAQMLHLYIEHLICELVERDL